MIKKVISGGQTGVDQAALAMALEAGIDVGGFCPRDGLDENRADIRLLYPSLNSRYKKINLMKWLV